MGTSNLLRSDSHISNMSGSFYSDLKPITVPIVNLDEFTAIKCTNCTVHIFYVKGPSCVDYSGSRSTIFLIN
jgi:hypothetical protein